MDEQTVIQQVTTLPVSPGLGIGVFDSGSGGMVTAGFVAHMLEEADLLASTVFFGDTKNLPYGTRQEAEVAGFSDRIIRHLAPTCPVIGIACNTASAAWTHFGAEGKGGAGPQVFSVVQVAAEEAYARARVRPGVALALGRRAKVVGVLGTRLTAQIQSHAECIVAAFRDDLSRHAGHQLPIVPYQFGARGPEPALPSSVIDYSKSPHIAVLREDEQAPGGVTRATVRHLALPADLPEALVVVARDAQELVAAVDVEHVLDAEGCLKPEWQNKIHDYLKEHIAPLMKHGATALILGCTHFEYFARDFASLLPTMAARNAIVSPSGALAVRLLDAWLATSADQVKPVTTRRYACFGYSGSVPPDSMFRSLHLDKVTRVDSLTNASS